MPRWTGSAAAPHLLRGLIASALAVGILACGGTATTIDLQHELATGTAAQDAGKLDACVTAYSNVLSVEPNSVAARVGRAACEPGRSTAIQDLDAATKLSPEDPALFLARADAYSSLGNDTDAASDYLHVVALVQTSPDQCVLVARSLTSLHFYADAERALDACLNRFPNNWQLHDLLALVSGALDKDDVALHEFNTALASTAGTTNASVLYDRARFYITRDRLQQAVVDASKALGEDPHNYGIYEQRAQVRQTLGDYQGAEGDFGSAMSDETRYWHDDAALVRLLIERGSLYVVEGQRTAALADLHRAGSLVPSSDDATRATIEQGIAAAQAGA